MPLDRFPVDRKEVSTVRLISALILSSIISSTYAKLVATITRTPQTMAAILFSLSPPSANTELWNSSGSCSLNENKEFTQILLKN